MTLEVKDLKLGQIIYECESGLNIRFEITSEPYLHGELDGKKQYACTATRVNGEKVRLLETENSGLGKLNIYDKPQYYDFVNGKLEECTI